MVKRFHVELIKVELKKNDYDLVNFELIYHLVVDYEFCCWNVSKLKSDFIKLNQVLPESFPGDISLTFPFWGIRPTDARLAKHEELVGQYVSFLGTLTSHPVINDFLETRKHDVLCVALDVLKEHRGSNESEVEVWYMLNSCDEDLILTEKQLHSINSCTAPSDLQIPFLELRRALENVENVKVIGNGIEERHTYKPSPNLDMSHFQSLTSLTLVDIDFKGVSELGNLSETLQHLTIKAEIQEIKDILIWVFNENDREPVAWNSLETLDLSYNSIETMDESLQLVIQLTTLNLSFNKILSINSIQGLPYLRHLDLSQNNIIETDALHLKMGNITHLNLAHNCIKLLYGFERMFSLEDLNLSFNCIDQLNELNRLARLPQLEHLSLSGNAIARKSSYRADVLALFYEKPTFLLDKEATSPAEFRKLQKILEVRREVEVKVEESICVVEISLSEESIEIGEDSLTFNEISLHETHFPSKKSRLATMASISEVEERNDNNTLENSILFRERTITIVDVEKMVRLDGDNWLSSFMDTNDIIFVKPATPPQVLKVTEETLKRLDSGQPKQKKKQTVADGTESYTTESSKESKDSKTHSPISNDGVIRQKSEVIPFHIVANEVYNIDEKIGDLVCRYSSLSFGDLQTNYSVYRDDQFFVMGLVPASKPLKPELLEIRPRGGKITWSLFPSDIESCSLIGDRICIKKYGDEAPRTYSQLFLHDMAHLYLLLTKMKEIRQPEPSEELCKSASDRILLSVLHEDLNEDFDTFSSHCFRYCKADVPLPVVIAITDTEVFIIKIDSHDMLNLDQDMLTQILANDSCQVSVLHREKISNLRQILRSYFQHTVRIEFKEDNNPFGSPETTFTLLGFISSDIDTFIEAVAKRLDSQNIPPTEVIITEQENDLRLLKRVLRIQDLQQINCISIRLESCYNFRCLVMTEHFLHMLEEDFVRWPPPCFVRHPPLTPRYSIVQQIRTRFIFGITLYSEIYHGSYVLTLNYYTSLKSFERGKSDIFISSFESREQLVGHIKRTWRQYYKKDISVSDIKRYEVEVEVEVEGGRSNGVRNGTEFTVENISNISMDKVQRFVGEVLNDCYNILYLTKTYCLSSHSPDTEYRCIVIITEELLHVLVALPPPTPAKLGSLEQDNRVSDHLGLLLSHPVTDVSQIVCGFFEQKIRFEFGYNELGLVTFMTRNVEKSRHLHRAVVESLHCQYQTHSSSYESDNVLITRKGRELSIRHLDEDLLDELRFTIAKHDGIPDYNEVQILSYSLFYQVVGDSRDLITVVLTHQYLYLIQEDNIFWPLPQSNQHRMPNTVQFKIVESIPLEDIMCVHYTHFTSCDVVILYENSEIHHHQHNRKTSQEFYLIEAVEKMGKTATLHTTTYQQRDHLIRTICQLRIGEELPVKKLGA